MPRTPLAQNLVKAVSVAAESSARQVPVEQVLHDRAAQALTRREFLGRTTRIALAGLGAMAVPGFLPAARAAGSTRVAIVGAGLAGLTCAYRLKQAGLKATVYEANTRLGGRCWTRRGAFDDGQIAERGGELIDTGHTALRRLARELDLKLDDLLAAETRGTEPCFFFDGTPYSLAEASADFKTIYPKLQDDLLAADYPTLHDSYTPRGRELDHLSILDWINESVPGGTRSKLGQLLDVAYNIEYGAESAQQSSLNLLYLLGYSKKRHLQIFGESDERFHIRGGNDQVVSGLADALGHQIQTGTELVALARGSDGSARLTFQTDGAVREVRADKVVLALPFSILRRSVDLSQAGFSALKQTAIQEQGMGTNSKLQLQFKERLWRDLGCNGETFSDRGYQTTWEASRAQPGRSGLLVNFTGGDIGAGFNQGTVPGRARNFLKQLEPVLPGSTAAWNGRAILDYWTGRRWTRGSYSYWKVGQYTKFAGIEGAQEGNCHFAGEHTSTDFQGFLNGAVESGERAATEILAG